jgi:sigma-54 dependent transcriptional regulator, acetoin dehydrogenase operon transcriptional activator AcoR
MPRLSVNPTPPHSFRKYTPMRAPFFATHDDRVSLAKTRYFEEGILPTGVVNEAIFQSWSRCHRARLQPSDRLEFQPVTASRSQLALQKNRGLHEAWLSELPALGSVLGSANCSAILTDATGVLIGATPSAHTGQRIMPVAHRVGVSLAEDHVGTTAPGLVVHTGKQACVLGGEHYFDAVKTMHCAAAPIRNSEGQLAGILDISSEQSPFQFDPASVVGLYAASIENRFLVAQSRRQLLVSFQFLPALVDTPMAGILGFDLAGQLLWLNTLASDLLSLPMAREARSVHHVDDVFELGFSTLASMAGRGVQPIRLRSGVQIFAACRIRDDGPGLARPMVPVVNHRIAPQEHVPARAPDAHRSPAAEAPEVSFTRTLDASVPVATPVVDQSLRQADADLIRQCLEEFRGNVSRVAQRLKVSRGLIYRRLKELDIDPTAFKSSV